VIRIGIVIGSTRPGRHGEAIGHWVDAVAQQRSDADFNLIDLVEFDLPLLDEPLPPAMGEPPEHEHTRRWAKTIDACDGFVLVTPEYNHSPPAALKNALDFLFREWNDKAVAFVSYGSAGGVRAVEHLRQVVGELKMADIRPSVALQFGADFDPNFAFRPREFQEQTLHAMLDDLVVWSEALKGVRSDARSVPQSA
jgi:NAD(P)H-dependent FMN reductase